MAQERIACSTGAISGGSLPEKGGWDATRDKTVSIHDKVSNLEEVDGVHPACPLCASRKHLSARHNETVKDAGLAYHKGKGSSSASSNALRV